MFSPVGGPQEDDQDIDWAGDLKFYIDNSTEMLEDYFFPAVKKHRKHINHPDAYKIYIKPLKQCLEAYCEEFKIEDREEKFPDELIEDLAQRICKEQKTFIERGDYK